MSQQASGRYSGCARFYSAPLSLCYFKRSSGHYFFCGHQCRSTCFRLPTAACRFSSLCGGHFLVTTCAMESKCFLPSRCLRPLLHMVSSASPQADVRERLSWLYFCCLLPEATLRCGERSPRAIRKRSSIRVAALRSKPPWPAI